MQICVTVVCTLQHSSLFKITLNLAVDVSDIYANELQLFKNHIESKVNPHIMNSPNQRLH